MEIFDAHTHMNDTPFRGKEEVYLQRAADLHVTKMACVGQDLEYNKRALDLAKKFDNFLAKSRA
ncbi:TatD family hydrolase, partial [Lactobacillus jensenii]|uniref:TatD family hydrolase n=1 Tax=Lactobacillus jensenii TaxID=109790 RepID=UPI00286FF48C